VIGARLVPLMLAAGHAVAAMTRTAMKCDALRQPGVTPVLCDLFDRCALSAHIESFRPDIVMHQVTDLPDQESNVAKQLVANRRVRSEGTHNLLHAAKSSGASRFVAQSIAWPAGAVVKDHEDAVVAVGGTVLRYGQFYGPGTYHELNPPPHPRIQIDAAAHRTMSFLDGPAGLFSITETEMP